MIRITMENGKVIELQLDAAAAPITVANFEKLARQGFYNGLTGMGGPGWEIKGEFRANGVDNPIKHTRGVISMARAQNPDSAGSQFFIMHADAPYLDGQYAAFGHVTSGMEVVDEIAATPTDWSDRPRVPVVMKTVEVVD